MIISKSNYIPIKDSHIRLGSRKNGVWVPNESESEARAVLYGLRKNPKIFSLFPSFDTPEQNPLHGIPTTELLEIAKLENVKQPWENSDVDITINLFAVLDEGSVTPVVCLKMNDPMVHIAALSYFIKQKNWSLGLHPTGDDFNLQFFPVKGGSWGVSTKDLRDNESMIIRKLIETKNKCILSLPKEKDFYNSITPHTRTMNGSMRNCWNISFKNGKAAEEFKKYKSSTEQVKPAEHLKELVT